MQLEASALEFVTERHLATLTTLRSDGTPHVTPVGFTWDSSAGLARVICSGPSQKAVNARTSKRAALCQVEGGRWITLEGTVEVVSDPERVADAVRRYTVRYRRPRENPLRVALEITVDRVLGRF
ncbi:TIGR03618 family F420-dependent PPOX class oxidoreductase [Cryptosporangium sp. NPDC051539]|uniref:TIGR03618 family F420-dependent PPOX class oxidoreductase n=1 Tax=Cryptosporangium sp. NPDC051539 TaxID=3363962 RepID=UPI0037AB3DCE